MNPPSAGKAPIISAYEHAMPVRELLGYESTAGSMRPVWGDRLAIYHPATSQFTALGDDAWQVLDQCSGSAPVVVTPKNEEIIASLADKYIVVRDGEVTHFPFVTDVDKRAEIYIETTEACNFSCAGCAVGVDRYDSGATRTMSERDVEMLLRSAVASSISKGFGRLHVKWAGGEPLMPQPFELVKFGQRVIADLREEHPDFEMAQVIITNGSYLSDEVVAQIASMYEMVMSVSLWGVGDVQDAVRGVKNKRFDYGHIVEGMRRLCESGVDFKIHHVINPENAPYFGDFVRAVWDVEHESFLGRDWNWPGEKRPLDISKMFFRPQTAEQAEMMRSGGYVAMVEGLRNGFEVMRELIERGIPIPSLDNIDYMQLSDVIPTVCGSGLDYFAAGPRGVSSCHEGLFEMKPNMIEIKSGRNMIDVANEPFRGHEKSLLGVNKRIDGVDSTTAMVLGLHGGTGCPRVSHIEHGGDISQAASSASQLYAPILDEVLSLETMRRLDLASSTIG